MRAVWRFQLYSHRQAVKAPGLGRLLHVAIQDGHPMLWAEVDTDVESRHCVITVVGTGRELPADELIHVGSFLDGPLVWHAFATEPTS